MTFNDRLSSPDNKSPSFSKGPFQPQTFHFPFHFVLFACVIRGAGVVGGGGCVCVGGGGSMVDEEGEGRGARSKLLPQDTGR